MSVSANPKKQYTAEEFFSFVSKNKSNKTRDNVTIEINAKINDEIKACRIICE
jgi:hypothetical protein